MSSTRTLTFPISIGNIAEKLYQFGLLNDNEEIMNEKDVLMITIKVSTPVRGIQIIRNEP